jgi:hypothetical protein
MEEKSAQSKKGLWALLGCLGLVVLFCAAAVVAASAWFFIINRQDDVATEIIFQEAVLEEPLISQPSPQLPPTNTPLPKGEPVQAPEDQTNVDNGSSQTLDPHALQRSEIEANVSRIRGLEPKDPVIPTFLTTDELRIRLEEDLLEDYGPEEARIDALTLSAFDFVPADFDLQSFILDLYTEQIAGYYDPENDEFVIISGDDDFGGVEQLTHAHEFVHALQDQHFDLEMLDDESLNSEEAFAMQAFVEGEATLVQMKFLESGYFDLNDLADLFMDLIGATASLDMDILESAPPVLAHELEFPYLNGLEFVQVIYDQGGFEAVNDVWKNPPTTTEQIIHPDRYLSGNPALDVSITPLDDVLGQAWELTDEDTLGEFYLREYLAQQLDNSQVDLAATGWGGDRYVIYFNDDIDEAALLLRIAWDTPADRDEFESAYIIFADQRFGFPSDQRTESGRCWIGDDVICIKSIGEDTLIIRVPAVDIADSIASSQR